MGKLKVQGLAKSFGATELFREVSFQINDGDKVGLVGANGTGKTTLFRIILGQEEYDDGEVRFEKADVGYVDQHAVTEANDLHGELRRAFADVIELEERKAELEKAIARGDDAELMDEYARVVNKFEGLAGYDYESRLRRVAFGLGFTEDDFALPVANFSGGEKTRLCLAKALIREPDFLLLDEPTNHLDIRMIEWLEDFLVSYKGSVLIISHDRFFLDKVATRIIELANHTTVTYEGNYSKYMVLKTERRLALESAYNKQQAYIKKTEEYIRKYRAGIKSKQARGRQSRLNRLERIVLPPEAANFQYFAFHRPVDCADHVLEAENLIMEFDGTPLFAAGDLLIRKGEGVALIGANGAGKTTLLKLITGELFPAAGKIKLGSRVKIGYFSQQHDELTPTRTVLEEILYDDYGVDEPEARNYLGAFLFRGDEVYRRVGELSGGERARLAFLKLMLTGANFLVLDEPTNHLDIPAKEAVEEALLTFPGTFLVVSHDRYFVDKVASTVWELEKGKITVYNGDYAYYRFKKQFAALPTKEQPAKEETIEPVSEDKSGKLSQSPPTTKRGVAVSRTKREEMLQRLEAEIAMSEAELKGLEYEMNLPETQADMDKSQKIAVAYAEKEKEIADRYDKWAELSEVMIYE